MQNKDIQEKTKQTNLDRYGVGCTFNVPEVNEKIKKTMINRYGCENPFQSKEIYGRFIDTMQNKYGVSNPMYIPGSIEKAKNTCLERHRFYPVTKNPIIREQINKKAWEATYKNFSRFKDTVPLFLIEEFDGEGPKVYKWKRKSTNEEFEAAYWGFEPWGKFTSTSIETFIINFLNKHNIEFSKNVRNVIKPYELDFYIPSHNLAIEVHGIYFHSTRMIENKDYHRMKYDMCKEKGIRLIQIFEDQIRQLPHIIINRLSYILKLPYHRINGRDCIIKEIDSNKKDLFLDKYHLQGSCSNSSNLGAFYKNHLVAVMTFGKARAALGNKDQNHIELIRFATVGKFKIPGIANKLFKHFIRNYNADQLPIISYSDLNWGEGNLYLMLGFNLDGVTPPGYFYFKNGKRFNRYIFRKSELSTKLENFDPNLTEEQNMQNEGYLKIYTSGNNRYKYNY